MDLVRSRAVRIVTGIDTKSVAITHGAMEIGR
jgi:hypothetical protein